MYAHSSAGSIYLPDSAWPIVYQFDEPQSVAVQATSTDAMTRAGKNVADAPKNPTDELRRHGIQGVHYTAPKHSGVQTASSDCRRPQRQSGTLPPGQGIPAFERAEAWGVLMQRRKRHLHFRYPWKDHHHLYGDPTFSWRLKQDPTVMIGGICPFSMPATGWARETPLCWRAASIVTRF